MKNSITPAQISQNNLKLIYQYIYANGPVSQQDIAYSLRLSRTTVTTKLSELETCGLIRKSGQIASDLAGRKAAAYSIDPEYRFAIGVEILSRQVKILRVDLKGVSSHRIVIDLEYENTDEYPKKLCREINRFIDDLPSEKERILGIGLAIPGLVSTDGTEIVYGKIFNCTGLKISAFSRLLDYPCRFLHDSDACADSELWHSPELKSFLYMNISEHLGSSMVNARKIVSGPHGRASTLEHIQVQPRGKECYCGNRGCLETICSISAIIDETGLNEEEFFQALEDGRSVAVKRWKKFLTTLALAINNMHLVYDTTIVLGGYLAAYLDEDDINTLYETIEKLTPFPEERNYIQVSKMPKHSITIGAGLPYIRHFLDGDLM